MNKLFKRAFHNADDKTLKKLAERYPAAGNKEREKIYSMIVKKYSDSSKTIETEYADEVRGVDIYMKKRWRKPAAAAAASLILAGGVFGGTFVIRNMSKKDVSSDTNIYSSEAGSTSGAEQMEKTIISVACLEGISDFDKVIDKFNFSQNEYKIQKVDYHKYDDENGKIGEGAYRQLKLDIISGDAPDIIITSDHSFIESLSQKGAFADLDQFMAVDPDVNRDTLLPNVLKALETSDGKLYSIASQFVLHTMAVKEKYGQNENWSIDDMIALFDSAPSTADHLYDGFERDTMLDYLVNGQEDLVDYDNAECHFDSDEFIKILEFSNRFVEKEAIPDKLSDPNGNDQYWSDKANWYKNDSSLLDPVMIFGYTKAVYSEFSGVKYLDFGGENFTLVGYPTSSGNGGKIDTTSEFAILENCSDKNGAWQFIRQFFTKEAQDIIYSDTEADYKKAYPTQYIRVRKDCFEEWLKGNKYCWEYSDKEEKFVKTDHTESKGTTVYGLTDKEIEDYGKYILSCDTIYRSIDTDIINICKEEAAAYFHGDCTAKQAADRIQSRCSILLSENS